MWHPDTYWHAVLKGWDNREKNLFLVQTTHQYKSNQSFKRMAMQDGWRAGLQFLEQISIVGIFSDPNVSNKCQREW